VAQAEQIDFTSLIAALNALTQTIGSNGRTLNNILAAGVNYFHIVTAGTFVVQDTPGSVLISLNVNTTDNGETVTFYDSASASSLTDMVANVTLGTTTPDPIPFGGERGLTLNNGLVIVTSGTADLTIGST
jgi:hypothetical protein